MHGKQQNKEILRTRLGRIPPKMKSVTQFIIIDAPHLDGLASDGSQVRTWFNRDDNGNIDSESIHASLEYLKTVWIESGPFDGILGFSMGGTLSAVMTSQLYHDTFPSLKFGIFIGSPDIPEKMLIALGHNGEVNMPENFKSLHIAGLTDNVVPIEWSRSLVKRFHNPVYIEHEQGHCIPMKAEMINQVVNFVKNATL